MTTFQMRPVCAAVLALLAQAAGAQSNDNPATGEASTSTPPAANAAPAAPAQSAQVQQVQQVRVTGLRSSIRSAEAIKRDSVQVVDSINAEDIGKFPDVSAGDALQRIAGVQVQRDIGETNTVIVRGLPDVVTTLNGMEYFTSNGRRLQYQELPVQSIGGLDVFKTSTPNQIEGGIAGGIDVRLRQPFDAKGRTVTGFIQDRRQTVNGSDAAPTRNNPGGNFSASDRWNTSYGEMGALIDLSFNREHWGYPVQWVDRPDRVHSVDANGVGTRLGDPPLTPAPGARLGELPNVGGVLYAGDRDRASVHGAFQWKVNPTLEANVHYLGTGYRGRQATDYILAITTWTPTLYNVRLAPQGGYCNTPEGVICPIQSAYAPAQQYGGPYDWDPYVATSTWGVKEHTTTHFLNLGLNYREGPWKASSNLAWNKSTFVRDRMIVDQQVPGASVDVYTYGADGHGGYNSVTTPASAAPLRDPNAFVLRGMVQNWDVQKGEQVQWRGDGSYRLGDGFFSGIDAGLRLSTHRASARSAEGHSDIAGPVRANPVAAFGAGFESLVPGIDRLGGRWLTPSRDYLIDQADNVRAFYGAPAGRVPDDPTRAFDLREDTSTVYLAARWKTKAGGVDLSGTVGGRYIHVTRELRGNYQIGDVVTPLDVNTSENNFLPSAAAVIGWRENLQSHLSIGKTITRPAFDRLNPALSLVPLTVNAPGTGLSGNPNLRPTRSVNTDATLEYYFPKNGFVQLALFHRDIDGYLQDMESSEVIGGQTYRVTRPQNSGKGTLKGAEFGIQKFFDFLQGPWSNFGAQFNYTWTDGENQTLVSPTGTAYRTTALTNVAKKNYNFALLYEGNGITGRLTATHRGDYVEFIGEPRFFVDRSVKATTFVDLSVSYAINKNVSVQFDAVNLTHEKFESYLGSPLVPRDIRYNPTTYGLGLRFSL